MLINTIRVAFRHSTLFDIVLFLSALWHTILIACHMRRAPVPVETDEHEIQRLRLELEEVEREMMEMDEVAENDEMDGELAYVSMSEPALRRLESNPYNPQCKTRGFIFQELQAKCTLLNKAKELRARLGHN